MRSSPRLSMTMNAWTFQVKTRQCTNHNSISYNLHHHIISSPKFIIALSSIYVCKLSKEKLPNYVLLTIYALHAWFSPFLCRKWQARDKKEADELKSVRLSVLSTLKRTRSSSKPCCTLSTRLQFACQSFQLYAYATYCTLKRTKCRELRPVRWLHAFGTLKRTSSDAGG